MSHKPTPTFSFRDKRYYFIGGIAVAILVISTVATVALMQLRQQVEAQTAMATQNMAKLMEQTYDGMIDMIDVALLSSADEIKRQITIGKNNTQYSGPGFTDNSLRWFSKIGTVKNERSED